MYSIQRKKKKILILICINLVCVRVCIYCSKSVRPKGYIYVCMYMSSLVATAKHLWSVETRCDAQF